MWSLNAIFVSQPFYGTRRNRLPCCRALVAFVAQQGDDFVIMMVDRQLSNAFNYDTIDHDLLMKLVQRRVRDARVLRLIRRWLQAGVMLEGIVTDTVIGVPQGAPISPLPVAPAPPAAELEIPEYLRRSKVEVAAPSRLTTPRNQCPSMTSVRKKTSSEIFRTPRWLRGSPRSVQSIINPEEVSIYRRMRKAIIQELRPKTPIEWILVNEFVHAQFSAMRYGTWQATVMQFSVGEGLRRAVKNRLRSGNKGSEADLTQQQGRMIASRAGTLIALHHRRQVQPVDHLHNKPRQMLFGKPFIERGRKQKSRLAIKLAEIAHRWHPGGESIAPEYPASRIIRYKSDRLLAGDSYLTCSLVAGPITASNAL